ncbi:hypothetical protein JCM3774_000359 [Rhodotorula dairenensis]
MAPGAPAALPDSAQYPPTIGAARATPATSASASAEAAAAFTAAAAASTFPATMLQRKQLVQRNLEMMSLPTQDSPAYYDSTSSAGSDSDLSDFAAIVDDHEPEHDDVGSHYLDLARPCPTHPVPTTNRGHKLSRLAPHTRRGKLGHYPHADAGFAPETAPGLGAVPAHKRRKLNDVAPYSSEAGFPVAPNLHLVPRPLHSLSREPDRPAEAYLPPVPQSPLDLLLMPSVQHTLGKKNQTFHLLGASATALIEQEAELINALGRVCRGLRGEGFEWRWEGDDGRRQAKKDAAKGEEERNEVTKDSVQELPAAPTPVPAPAPAPGTSTDLQAVPVAEAPASASTSDPATNPAIADLQGDEVKLEQATPILQSAIAPVSASTEQPVAVPGVGGAQAEEDTEMQAVPDDTVRAAADAPPAVSQAPDAANGTSAAPPTPSLGSAVTAAVVAQGTDSGAGGSAPPPSAQEAVTEGPAADVRSSAPPSTTAAADDENAAGPVPAIAVTGPGSEHAEAGGLPGDESAASAAAIAGDKPAEAEADATGTAEGTPAPSAAGGDDLSGPAAASSSTPTAAAAAAAAAVRRRSGRVPAAGRGGVRHTRSRQSSPEDEGLYTSAGEDDALLYDDEAEPAGQRRTGPAAAGGSGAGAASTAGARAQLVPEEELPEYAQRMIDPEGYVRSLFVTEDKVELERLVPAPSGGMVGTGQFDSLTPNEQEVLLHDCMTDLHRFLADALEYRNRLSEIRDGILAVERRRKGMWKVVRTVANDFLAEEEGAVYGQHQQQQQQQDGYE